ncbi:hypothetical protein E2C01_039282 [Portunus trituberculatus]|uniref:Uncharacterized protein n=1 Tax=Portunus trituberculatus TaxID=210409 RepID=A0A5B7FKY7_PORTR|nr:hypothetical protein [Portunus trituberculatus]
MAEATCRVYILPTLGNPSMHKSGPTCAVLHSKLQCQVDYLRLTASNLYISYTPVSSKSINLQLATQHLNKADTSLRL